MAKFRYLGTRKESDGTLHLRLHGPRLDLEVAEGTEFEVTHPRHIAQLLVHREDGNLVFEQVEE